MWSVHLKSSTTQSTCLDMFTRNSTTLKTHQLSVQMAEPILSLSLLHANDVSREQKLFVFMSISCLRHRFSSPSSVAFRYFSRRFGIGRLYCHLSKKKRKRRTVSRQTGGERKKKSLKVKRQTSSLVFIFIFYISLNVQRVSCSIVKYLYIHMYLG